MELVKWDGTQFVPDETNSSYDYNSQQWANAKVTIDGVESYFVWITRYEYKINYNTPGTPEDGGTIDIKFIPTNQTTADEGYIIHPAFTSDVNNGGWSEELPGIWVGKYETARSDSEGETQGTSTTIKVQPGVVTSWRNTKIGDIYNYARAYSPSLNSHMLKNSEWGAVAYLTESKYGRNGTEVTKNGNSNYITADAGIIANPEQSSTGNVYGIYDLSGGAYEFVTAYYSKSSELSPGSSFANGLSDEYSTAYIETSVSSSYKLGDATYETNGWYEDEANFFVNYSNRPFLVRGGHYDSGGAGIFAFNKSNGYAVDTAGDSSFRMCLAVK